ncbi:MULTISPECIES: SDR family NAD(P)-dependent oxidoreductase [Caballeronia]|uniref:3-oxoacyl-ACP reductase n=1 Tax=Caballeronia zhejiangensis TaxID=871203 RepID=A0A656QQ80_9BURK|nr:MULTISPECIES: SDR family NAD(P)-dependent oxidoreductase [Caballeronia]EKS70951.1 short-chain dehydrogenase/reductase [Burkholderia sp. SJ98]KDR33979.1 3-oxoacyl-ACP reductase [Caballeronia zhejiangensis]MCG7403919.1 SDR family oxidoreductase [Caballeronia zhejiangensis]MCI1044616.1 SDR family oxidoreductase [Caballeronia zhejiangensis]MDR5788857.1 SDR family NAD(P)-dependent oxidoreductase [Caballeronia sp. LP003]
MQTNTINLADRVAVVTGGAQGIGLEVGRRLLESGARLVVWDVNPAGIEQARTQLRRHDVHFERVDIADYASVQAAVAATLESMGRIDILVNNAAIVGPNAPLIDYPIDIWKQVMEIDVNGTFHCCRAVVPEMVRQNYGRIVNLASVAGKEGNPNAAAYSSAKAAVIAMTKSLGKELARHDIAVNCVTPAVARTPGAMEQAPEHIEYMLGKIPRGRFLELNEAAAMIAWLVSEENSFTTGAVFDLSGGRATY